MSTLTIASDEVRKHVNGLEAIGDQMEAAGDPRWLPIAQAAALLEGLRLGITRIADAGLPEQPRWIGLDMAKPGTDRTVRSKRHA